MPSAAFTRFLERILEVKRLLSLCAKDDEDYRIKKENAARDEALLRGAHVLLCSHLEGYFEDLISDLIEAYDYLTTDVSRLPEQLRAWQVMGAASKWETKDPMKRWANVQSCTLHPLVNKSTPKTPGCMEPGIHIDGFSNPGKNEIESLFKTVGLDEIWDRFIDKEPDKIIIGSVDAIVNRRNQIAHGKVDATITLSDAKLYVMRAERIAEVFEELVTLEVNARLSLPDCWKALENLCHDNS